jgi:hypothetical protein
MVNLHQLPPNFVQRKKSIAELEKMARSGGEDGGEETKKGLHIPGSPEFQWRAMGDSNARPLVPETNALSN